MTSQIKIWVGDGSPEGSFSNEKNKKILWIHIWIKKDIMDTYLDKKGHILAVPPFSIRIQPTYFLHAANQT
jgi:hypothetical protein